VQLIYEPLVAFGVASPAVRWFRQLAPPSDAMTQQDRLIALDLGRGDGLDAEVVAYLRKCEEKLGFVPNVLRAYAFDNAKLKAFIMMADDLMLGDSGLTKAEREMIAVAVSAVNHCHYCLTSHGAALRQRAGDPVLGETVAQNYRAAGLEPRHEAMLDFCVKLTEAPDKIREADRKDLRRAGFSDRDIWDIAAVASFYNMTNRLAAATDMKPNLEYHHLARAHPVQRPNAASAPAPAPSSGRQRLRRGAKYQKAAGR
jgi:uncharacterized peroxidase-related enzyme